MTKTLLIIGGGVEACEGIKIAKRMGLKLIVADSNPQAPGFQLADYKFNVSTYDYAEMINESFKLIDSGINIDGVIAMCADVPLTVAMIADKFELSGLSIQSAEWVSDKLLMKKQLAIKGIAIPKFMPIYSDTKFTDINNKLGIPFVVKPVDSRGARGVQLIENESQFFTAFITAELESPSARVMAEEYLSGPQVSTETLVDDGKCYTIGFCDRNYEWLERTKPFMIENGGDAPSLLSPEEQSLIVNSVEAAAKALNINSGVVKGDMVLTDNGAKVIEVAGRLSGGYFSTTQIPLATGVNFVEQAILLALGKKLKASELVIKNPKAVAIRYLDFKPGTIKNISGIDDARGSSGVKELSVSLNIGEKIKVLNNHTQRCGFVITQADSKADAIEYALSALAKIKVAYE